MFPVMTVLRPSGFCVQLGGAGMRRGLILMHLGVLGIRVLGRAALGLRLVRARAFLAFERPQFAAASLICRFPRLHRG